MKIAIVTGASSGLGREFVRHLDTAGLDEIWVNARRQDRLLSLQEEIRTKIRVIAGDISDDQTIGRIQELLETERPVVQFLFNNAGFGKMGGPSDLRLPDLQAMIRVNDLAAVTLTMACLPHMKRGSRIAQICSVAAFMPIPYLNVYAASKAFLYHYSRALAVELAPRGIAVTAVCPYWVKDTEFINVAKRNGNGAYFPHFLFGSQEKNVAASAWRAVCNGDAVATPGWVATLLHWTSHILPYRLIMAATTLVRRL